MKRLIHITILSVLLLAGCSKPSPAPAPAPEQYDRYIFFSQGVQTKASLIEEVADMDGQNFGVVGFKYDAATTWSAVKADATPNVFYDEDPDAPGSYIQTDVESVSVDGTNNSVGTGSYAPLQGWSNSKKYAFFAYFPLDNSTVSLVNTDGSDYTGGVPAIRYTMDPTSGETFRTSMEDVMTAPAQIDKFWKSSAEGGNNVANGEVNFSFEHRLSSLGLNVKNSTAGGITVNSVSFNISGLKNQSVIFPLDGGTAVYGNEGVAAIACSLTIPEGGTAIGTSGTEFPDRLILIPQTDPVTLTVTVGYTRTLDGYADNVTSHTTYELSTALNEGKKHIVNLNFKDSTVDVEFKCGPWAESHTIDNTFN